VQACKSFGFGWLVALDRFNDSEVLFKQIIRFPIRHDKVANKTITNTHSLQHFVAGNGQKTLMKLVLKGALFVSRTLS
jgi:hypothetical protein